MKSLTNQQLNSQLKQVTQGIDQTIDWINNTRQHAIRLDIEASQLAVKLRRHRNKARHLSEMALTPMSIGFFGQSSAGKQHLISALIAGENGQLETTLAGKTLNFWQQIKPGYQSSGLVTRFSHQAVISHSTVNDSANHQSISHHENHPVQLSLLNEMDIAKIVASVFLRDKQQEMRMYSLDEQHISDHLQQLAMRRQPLAIAGITSDEVISLWDYLIRHDALRQKTLDTHFWPFAIELAPYLSIDDRAILFSLLWAESPPLTDAYRHFAYTLQHLGGTSQLLAPLSVLVDDTLLPANGIMNVAALNYLNTPADTQIQVLPLKDSVAKNIAAKNIVARDPVTVSLAELTLLSVELQIPLRVSAADHLLNSDKVFESVDLLEFPDYSDVFDVPTHVEHTLYPLAAALSQAKNTYLLERYTDKQQINLLLVCTAANNRTEVKVVGKALDYWVKQSQGENKHVRSRRNPGLIWALTPFDQRISSAGAKNHDEAVQRYVGNPGDSWGTMLALDTRGIERMVTYLAQEIRRDIKAERITEQLHELQRELTENLLVGWAQPATSELQQKQCIAETLLKTLQTRTGLHGELLERLLPSRDELRALYLQQPNRLRQQNRAVELVTPTVSHHEPFSIGIDIDLFSDPPLSPELPTSAATPSSGDYETEYAKNVQRYWINHLRQLPDNAPLIELLGITKPTIELLVTELITTSIRLDITGQLVKILADNEQVGLHRDTKADRQVSRALTVLGDFVAWLGFLHINEALRPDSRINRGYKIFAQSPQSSSPLGASQRLTKLALTPTNNTAFYIYDWLVGLGEMIIHNEGYSASSEISDHHREQLAAILILVKQNQH
ncbi:virulence factor SrfC family protein [Yersinia rochesterensis]|uniref:putative virulence factor n=1 Tax=Yersinia rochesterensis TaxID=1604335 RepID=UPI0025AABA02|nr:virulence factor SrfC family protein [Yersinia rochesterensis]MDN0105379.1 virulence factor SrfC family protein [Yersinia rochesterensis]